MRKGHIIFHLISGYGYDGDGKRVWAKDYEGYLPENPKFTTYVGNHYEVRIEGYVQPTSGGSGQPCSAPSYCYYLPIVANTIVNNVSYYYTDGQRIAMKTNGVVSYLYGDQLGSTSAVADVNGNLVSRTLYHPWGTTRYSQGTTPTDYAYTGQMQEGDIYFYQSRYYDPTLGRFIQPDTMVPPTQGTQGFDRYAYVNNNPLRHTDPSGHKACDGAGVTGDDCEISKSDIIASIVVSYHWNVVANWTKKELFSLLDAGIAIENKISTLTEGNGRGWMLQQLGGTSFQHNNLAQKTVMGILNIFNPAGIAGVVPGMGKGQSILLDYSGINPGTIVHELGHVLDNNTGSKLCAATWCGGGMADALTKSVGGIPSGIRWINSTSSIPDRAKWSYTVNRGYGNNSTADYFADAFSYLVIDSAKMPNLSVRMWMESTITQQNR